MLTYIGQWLLAFPGANCGTLVIAPSLTFLISIYWKNWPVDRCTLMRHTSCMSQDFLKRQEDVFLLENRRSTKKERVNNHVVIFSGVLIIIHILLKFSWQTVNPITTEPLQGEMNICALFR